MLDLGRRADRDVVCLLTGMDQPLGHAVGNALEIREAVETIRDRGPGDLTELVVEASARLLALSDLGVDVDEGRARTKAAVADGSAYAVYQRWIRAQGGDPSDDALPRANVVERVTARDAGYVARLSASRIATAVLGLGGGRHTKDDVVDHAVGVVCLRKRGDAVLAGEALAEVHARDKASAESAAREVLSAYELAAEAPQARPLIIDVLA